jgi:uncharacterized protein
MLQCSPDANAESTRRIVAADALLHYDLPKNRPNFLPSSLPSLSEVDDACRNLKLGIGASELHGALCGWIAGGGADGADWLGKLLVDDALPHVVDGSALDRLRRASVAQIEDRSFGFMLLMPDGSSSLAERSGALFDWCRGFLGAFGLAAGKDPPLSEEGGEALADIAKLAAAAPQEDGDEEDEAALAEIEEFVRVATLLLHGDCALGPRHRNRLN